MKISNIPLFFCKKDWGDLIKYWQGLGVLKYSLCQMLLTGVSKKSLILLEKGIGFKVYKGLYRKYAYVLNDSKNLISSGCTSLPNKVWIYSGRDINSVSELEKKCIKSIYIQLKDYEIILLDDNNITEYLFLPNLIIDKYKNNIISNAHFSEIIQVALLEKYGGIWIDKTVYCSHLCQIPKYMLESDFFVMQNLKPSVDGTILNTSKWFMVAKKGNIIISTLKNLLYEYWQQDISVANDKLLEYFTAIVLDFYPKEWQKIYQYPSSLSYLFNLSLFDKYNSLIFDAILSSSPFHKLNNDINNRTDIITDTNYHNFMKFKSI